MAELNISERQAGDITILDLDGMITIGEGSVTLRSMIDQLLAKDKNKILLNLATVSYTDSSGIGEIVSSYTAANKAYGDLKLVNVTEKIKGILTTHEFLRTFKFFESEGEALAAFA